MNKLGLVFNWDKEVFYTIICSFPHAILIIINGLSGFFYNFIKTVLNYLSLNFIKRIGL